MNKRQHGAYNKREVASAPLTMEDFNRLIDGLHTDEDYQWEAYCVISFVTALRVSDVLELKWGDVVNQKSLSFVEKKTRKSRTIPFDTSVRNKINKLWKLNGKPDLDLPIMLNNSAYNRTGEVAPYSMQYINRKLKNFKYKYRLEIPINQFSSHTFRKTFGRYVYDSNNQSFDALNLLNMIFGHSNIKTTQIYLGIQSEEIENIYKTIKF